METIIHNEQLRAVISKHGAELTSLRKGAREYIWQGDPKYWKRHAPILFPIVGRLNRDRYRTEGCEYALPQHGFARDSDFTLVEQEERRVMHELIDTPQTREHYPYAFRLWVEHRLEGNALKAMWHIENRGSDSLYFQIGAHPAFLFPNFKAGDAEHGKLQLLAKEGTGYRAVESFVRTPITADGYARKSSVVEKGDRGYFALGAESFAEGAWIIEHGQVQRAVLIAEKPYLAISFDGAPVVGVWSPERKDAPFVCIEPWQGRCDSEGYEGEFSQRDWTIALEGGGRFDFCYTIEIL